MAENLKDLLGRKPSVLIVDDDEDLLLVLQLTLAIHGYNVILSINAVNFFDLVASQQPDVIMLDITMNGVDGTDLCRQLKENTTANKPPVLMFSANRNVAELSRNCGADDYISKPFEIPILADRLSGLIKQHIH